MAENFIPTIKIAGKIVKPSSPKMKAWRKFLEFYDQSEENIKSKTLLEYTEEMADLIVIGFNREEVTKETIEENLSLAEFKNLTTDLFKWLQRIFFTGLEEIPNAEQAINPDSQV